MFQTLLVQPLFNLLAVIYSVIPGHDFGIAIIVLTVLVRVLLYPVIKKQLHSQKVINELGPKAAKIRAETKGDKQKEAQLIMELYKEKGVSPFSSIGPMIIQLPVFFALFFVLRDIVKPGEIERLAYDFVKGFGPIHDIISNQADFHPSFLGIFDLAAKKNVILAGVAGLAQYFQTKQLAPKHPDPQQQAMFKTTGLLFPALTIFIGYTLPAALSLYWAATSAAAIAQQHLILNRDVQEIETKGESKKLAGPKPKRKKTKSKKK